MSKQAFNDLFCFCGTRKRKENPFCGYCLVRLPDYFKNRELFDPNSEYFDGWYRRAKAYLINKEGVFEKRRLT